MLKKYYLIKLLTNAQGQDASSVSVFDTKDAALVSYHNILAAYHNAPDVLYAIVQIVNGLGNCEIMEIVNHIPETVDAPIIMPIEGVYAEPITVNISCPTSGATIYYTTDGTTPTAESETYDGAIAVEASTTIKAIALKDGATPSEVVSATYTIG